MVWAVLLWLVFVFRNYFVWKVEQSAIDVRSVPAIGSATLPLDLSSRNSVPAHAVDRTVTACARHAPISHVARMFAWALRGRDRCWPPLLRADGEWHFELYELTMNEQQFVCLIYYLLGFGYFQETLSQLLLQQLILLHQCINGRILIDVNSCQSARK